MVQLLKNVEHVHITSSYSIRAQIPVMVNFNVTLLVTIMVSPQGYFFTCVLKIFRIIENWIVWRGKKFSFLSILVYFITELFYAARAALMTTVYLLLEYQVQAQRNNQFNNPSNMTRASFNLSIAFSIAFPFPGVGLVTGAGVTAPTGAGIPSTFIYCCLCVDFIGTLFFLFRAVCEHLYTLDTATIFSALVHSVTSLIKC